MLTDTQRKNKCSLGKEHSFQDYAIFNIKFSNKFLQKLLDIPRDEAKIKEKMQWKYIHR